MTLSLLQITRLQSFKKQICSQCSAPYYSSRQSIYCSAKCKQAAYRQRQINGSIVDNIKVIDSIKNEQLNSKMNITNILEENESNVDLSVIQLEQARKRLKTLK